MEIRFIINFFRKGQCQFEIRSKERNLKEEKHMKKILQNQTRTE